MRCEGAADGALAAAGAAIPEAAKQDPIDFVSGTLLRPGQVLAGTADPASVASETTAILGNVVLTGTISDAERAYLVSAVVDRTGATQPQAVARVDTAVAGALATRDEAARTAADAKAAKLAADAEDAAIKAAEVARVTAILSAFLLAAAALVAGAAAYVGAVRGGRHRDEGRIFGGFAYRG